MITLDSEINLKQCAKCKEYLSLDRFSLSGPINKDGTRRPYSYCKACSVKVQKDRLLIPRVREQRRVNDKKYRQSHRPQKRAYSNARGIQFKERAIEALGGKCNDCQKSFNPWVYDFHHINPEEKDYNLGNVMRDSWTKIEKELHKCVLLCANCHRERHGGTNIY